jgi:membrane protein
VAGEASDEPPRSPGLRERLVERGLGFASIVVGRADVRRARAVLARYDTAGGGLLAAGLAFTALFALVPGALLILGVAGFVLGEGAGRGDLGDLFARLAPPLADAFATLLVELARNAAALSLVGLLALVWGVSRFNSALETALARVFHEAPRRGFVRRTTFSLLAVLVLVAAVLGGIVLAGAVGVLEERLVIGGRPVADLAPWRLLSTALSAAIVTVGIASVYRLVPTAHPRWGALVLPAAGVAVGVTVLTQVFVYVAPRLVGAAAVLGSVAAVFAALAWFSLVFQLLLLGAAWTAERSG